MSNQECESPEPEEEQAKPDSPFFEDIERRELHSEILSRSDSKGKDGKFTFSIEQVSSLAEKLEEMMFLIYDRHNKQMQDKLQELSEIMERISQIQTELRQVCHTVEAAYKDLCVQPEV
ncbi:Synaptonemal complex central element protein 2 [Chelonia mydas]|uniref:Synaptonemal complex central element protein 2 n=1 Tax=Chelonia mydas TaxID=8469 RepID=M7C9E8_CHEMY|nr:Synaptonemal complex central element protein 2 [Chelonia mydas]